MISCFSNFANLCSECTNFLGYGPKKFAYWSFAFGHLEISNESINEKQEFKKCEKAPKGCANSIFENTIYIDRKLV